MAEQIITSPSGERLVVVPEAEFNAMRDALEEREDVAAVEAFNRKLAAGEEELVPAAVANRILEGENKVRVWPEHRGMTARELAAKAAVSAGYLSQIETGARDGTLDVMKRVAAALGVSLDDLA